MKRPLLHPLSAATLAAFTPGRTAIPHRAFVAGESLKKMASSSRATGKVTATLVMTAACLSQNAPPWHHQTPPQRPSPTVGERNLDPDGVGPVFGGSGSDGADTTAVGRRPVKTSTETAAYDDLASSARTTLHEEARAGDTETSEKATTVTGTGEIGSGSHGERFVPCRQRTTGPLRGGDLM